KWSYIPTDSFAVGDDIWNGRVALGDDVFMIGMFVDHDGDQVNVPSARFGNISVMPLPFANIRQGTGLQTPSYVIDMHSRSGFSGSPVFMYRPPQQDLPEQLVPATHRNVNIDTIFRFLGIHFGQFPEEWEIGRRKPRRTEARKRGLITDGAYVTGWSGMTIV